MEIYPMWLYVWEFEGKYASHTQMTLRLSLLLRTINVCDQSGVVSSICKEAQYTTLRIPLAVMSSVPA